MSKRVYGQFCGFARALEVVGERWALMIVRDLLVGPKRFSDLRRGLDRIPTNILTARLKELESDGVVRRRVLPRPSGSIVYELTPYGLELEDAVVHLGRWGAKTLGTPRVGETLTVDALIIALRSTFRAEAARGLSTSYELRVGEIVLHARIKRGRLTVGSGPIDDPALIIEASPGIRALMAGELSPADAVARGVLHIQGEANLLDRFAEIFRIDPMPASD